MAFIIRTLVHWRRFILGCAVAGALAMTIVALLLPPWYRARTTLFPPEQSGVLPIPDEIVKRLSAPLMGMISTGSSPGDVCIEILRSRAVGEPLIAEFGLMQSYGAGSMEECLDALHAHSRFALLDNGMVVVTFEDRNPQRAAAITNRMIELLDEVTRGLTITRAARTREFVERQMTERKDLLAHAENELRTFQEENKAVDFDGQLTAAMELIGELSAQAITLEIEMKILAHYASPGSEEYRRRQAEYNEVVRQLGKLKGHGVGGGDDAVRTYLPALADVPDLALRYYRLRREVEVQTKVYKMLAAQYEKASMEAARDVPVIQVLDHAVAPARRARPNRAMVILAGTLVDLVMGAGIALVLSAWRARSRQALVAREVLAPIAADFARLRGRARP